MPGCIYALYANPDWPKIVKCGSVAVKVYRLKHKTTKSGFIYSVVYVDLDGKRKNPQLADLDEAMRMAKVKAEGISSGRPEMTELSRGDRDELVALRAMAGKPPPCRVRHA